MRLTAAAVLGAFLVGGALLFLWPHGSLINRGLVWLYYFLPTPLLGKLGISIDDLADLCNLVAFAALALGVALVLPRLRPWVIMAGGLLASLGIETIQALFLPERLFELQDVLFNTLGAVAGALVGWMFWNEILRFWRHRDLDRHQYWPGWVYDGEDVPESNRPSK